MEPIMRLSILVKRLVAISCLCVYAGCSLGSNSQTVELTQTDLFSLPDWQHRSVAISGFSLGISRAEASELARAHNLRLLTKTFRTVGDVNGPCRPDEESCTVYRAAGPWIGLDLFFDNDRLKKMKVSVSDDAIPEVQKVSVAREFKSLTARFFNHYSEDLRLKILGHAEGKETPDTPGAAITHVEYNYPQLGLIVNTTFDKRDHPPKPFDLEVDFVAHSWTE